MTPLLAASKPKKRRGWTSESTAYLERARQVIESLKAWWPVTLRAVYYQLVAALLIENCRYEYKKLSDVLTRAREEELIPWGVLEDRSRRTLGLECFGDKSAFVEDRLEWFLDYYNRDLLQSQEIRPEIWVEKDALAPICERIANQYCVKTIVAKGFASADYRNKCRQRVLASAKAGQRTRILYLGDLDPSGWAMLPTMMGILTGIMGLDGRIESQRCALTPEQALSLKLPRSIDAIKPKDTRTPAYKAMLRAAGHPDNLAVELDALPPATLEAMVRDAIETTLDLSSLEAERAEQEDERAALEQLRDSARAFIIERLEADA